MPRWYHLLLCASFFPVNFLDLHCDQMDLITAFFNGDFNEVFTEVPAGFCGPNRQNLIFRLLKGLYGPN